jgi:hypothetical protein
MSGMAKLVCRGAGAGKGRACVVDLAELDAVGAKAQAAVSG